MTYREALRRAEKVGASRAEGKPLLALLCRSLAAVHAINPALVYDGAVKQGIDCKTLMKLAATNPVATVYAPKRGYIIRQRLAFDKGAANDSL